MQERTQAGTDKAAYSASEQERVLLDIKQRGLTPASIAKLVCPPGKKEAIIWDPAQSGLAVRVTGRNNTKSYFVQYAYAGKRPRVPLGSRSAITLAQARQEAKKIMGEVAAGGHPAAERKAREATARRKAIDDALTLERLVGQWDALHLKTKRPSYRKEATRAILAVFEKHLGLPAASLDRRAVVRTIDRLVAGGKPMMAARAKAYGSACYQWAIRRGALEANPFASVPTPPTTKRQRKLTEGEIKRVFRAAEDMDVFGKILRMLLLTGQRREEVAGMTWGELSRDLETWIIPPSRAKNNVEHFVPLSPQAREIIAASPRGADDELVFAGATGKTPFSGFSKAKLALDRASGVEGWVIHDLRRTAATGLQKLGIRLEVTEAVLNHISGSKGGIAGVYQTHHWAAEKAAALRAWGDCVEALLEGGEPANNVAPLKAGA
jgi:integrase